MYALLVFILTLFITKTAFSATLDKILNENELKVCTTAGYAPFEVRSSGGKWVGFDVEMFELFAKDLGVKLNMIDMRWEGVFPALIAKTCDFVAGGVSVTEERKKSMMFSNPVYKSGNSLVILKKNKDKYKSLKELDKKGVKIAVKSGNTADFFLRKTLKNAKLNYFDSNADLISAVTTNKTEAFCQDAIFAQMALNEYKDKLFILPTKVNHEDLAVAVRKKDIELVNRFNDFLSKWKKNGGYDIAVDYYIKSDKWKEKLK